MPPTTTDRKTLAAYLAVACLLVLPMGANAWAAPASAIHNERPDDPPAAPAKVAPGSRTNATITYGRFTHVQVNVAAGGANIANDAANEPSIAVDPTNHDRMVVGWRQFDTVFSNFRQAGYGWTTNGGATWTASKIQPGVFRSDPVLVADAQGRFYYNSLGSTATLQTQVFRSTDGGATWGPLTYAYGGDKQWMTVDRTFGPGAGHLYQAWSTAGNQFAPNTFNRSIDGGASFQPPSSIPDSPVWGTLDVAPDGTLYVAGSYGPGTGVLVSRSFDAENPLASPTFTTFAPDIGGAMSFAGPNPAGLLGQVWIAVDPSSGPRSGWVYVLCSVETADDPLDVMFIRSTDQGATWSTPVRINDDLPGNGALQWFGSMSVSPQGRIDVTWNDTRGSEDVTLSALHYAYSTDGGATWSPNEQASPVWNCQVGWPNQAKIGDYYHMVSDATGADLAWSATFNGEQDVYYVRIGNTATGVPDLASAATRPRLHAPAPNPARGAATLHFEVPREEHVRLEVFDAAGRRVTMLVDGRVPAGAGSARWDGRDHRGRAVESGVYLCRLETAGATSTRKLLLLR